MKVDTHLLCGIRLFESGKVKGMVKTSDVLPCSLTSTTLPSLRNFVRPPSGNPSVAPSAVPGVGLEVTKFEADMIGDDHALRYRTNSRVSVTIAETL